MRGTLSLIGVLAALPACGCLATPNFAHPGSEAKQQTRAQIFPPYPENDAGPPIVGGQPRQYQPRAEVLRVQPRLGEPIVAPYPQPPPQQPLAQPPIVTAPPAIYCPPQPASPAGP